MAYTIHPESDWLLAEEYRQNPIGHHSPNLMRLLYVLRKINEDQTRYVLVMLEPLKSWVVGKLQIGIRKPVEIDDSVIYTNREDAEWAIFCIRWESNTGIPISSPRGTPLPKDLPC
jgi:hypothetical protein